MHSSLSLSCSLFPQKDMSEALERWGCAGPCDFFMGHPSAHDSPWTSSPVLPIGCCLACLLRIPLRGSSCHFGNEHVRHFLGSMSFETIGTLFYPRVPAPHVAGAGSAVDGGLAVTTYDLELWGTPWHLILLKMLSLLFLNFTILVYLSVLFCFMRRFRDI